MSIAEKVVQAHVVDIAFESPHTYCATCRECDWTYTGHLVDAARAAGVLHLAAVTEATVRDGLGGILDGLAATAHADLKADRRRTRADAYDSGRALALETAAQIARGVTQ